MRVAPRVASVSPSDGEAGSAGRLSGHLAPPSANGIEQPRDMPVATFSWMLHSGDFARTLRAPLRSATLHFALHHLAAAPATGDGPGGAELSTAAVDIPVQAVDDSFGSDSVTLGAVVPKRHARRAVTRSLIKRQVRVIAERRAARLGGGMWLVRLRAPFERARYPSAASVALKRATRIELETLFDLHEKMRPARLSPAVP